MAVRPGSPPVPWSHSPVEPGAFGTPPREYGILPFWFLNGELDPDEMRYQLAEFRDKGMPGIILHGRFGLETPYIGETYLDRIQLAISEAEKLGLKTWIYDEMNWPSGTADMRVLKERPELAQRYLECISLTVRGPWFACLTGGDSRYNDFERSTPVAAFAKRSDGLVVDLTPNLSFTNVIPWEVPPGDWTLMYMVEKRAEYYIDAIDPEATAEFLRVGYEPYVEALERAGVEPGQMPGFYTDEPAMHYYVTAHDNPIVPWTRGMFGRFHARHGYDLRRRLPDLFFDVTPDSARVRHDFYSALSEFYADAFYRQIHEWCQEHNVLFTGHLLYEEWLRQMIRVEGNLFRHYPHFDVTGVDHLYPIIGTADRPDEHVAMKVASSAAHQNGSERLLCESFGGIFMDATMRRMKWLTDWEYVLGVNLLNPHGFHYTLEGPRKRDWPPSMFYQYPWWRHYGRFSDYVARLSSMLTGGRHVAKLAVLWPINAMFANYRPQERGEVDSRIVQDFNALTDMLLRIHHDFDYVDEEVLAGVSPDGGVVELGNERHEVVVIPPMSHIRLATLEWLERFVAAGGAVLGAVMAPRFAFGDGELVDVGDRVERLFGARGILEPAADGVAAETAEHEGGGRSAFVRAPRLAHGVGLEIARQGHEVLYRTPMGSGDAPEDMTDRVLGGRAEAAAAVGAALDHLVRADVLISNPDVQYLHRVKDDRDLVFLINSTEREQRADVAIDGRFRPALWDPSTGDARPIAPWRHEDGRTCFELVLPPVGSAFVVAEPDPGWSIDEVTFEVEQIDGDTVRGSIAGGPAELVVFQDGDTRRRSAGEPAAGARVDLDGSWRFASTDNALRIESFLASPGPVDGRPQAPDADTAGWLEMRPGAWSYQLPVEPEAPYPVDVWYRMPFTVLDVPERIDLLVDGFAGLGWEVHLNGQAVTAEAVRSAVDSQMQALPLAGQVVEGENLLAVRITVGGATDGLLDRLKLVGPFGVEGAADGYAIVRPPDDVRPGPWTEQGAPFLSGEGVYRTSVELDPAAASGRVRLHADAGDDVAEVVVNGVSAGVALWAPYVFEVGDLLNAGANEIEVRVSNTAENLLGSSIRPSGLRAAPYLQRVAEVSVEAGV